MQAPSTHELHQEGHRLLPSNPHLALQCFARAAARGHGPSHAQLAYMHMRGLFTADKNAARAHELAVAGAALGCSDSKGVFGLLTHKGCRVPQNKQIGKQTIRESADAGSAWGQWALGLLHNSRSQNFIEAARYFRMAAEQGHAKAQFELGHMYQEGDGVAQDFSEAVRYCRMAAEQGQDDAQFELGEMYHEAVGVAGDLNEAARFYLMAAKEGHPEAEDRLGDILLNQVLNGSVLNEVVRYFRMEADEGNPDAMLLLGKMYEHVCKHLRISSR